MDNVDFREAELDGVTFSREISLNTCQFPQDERYLYLSNWPGVIEETRTIISNEWPQEEKTIGLELLDQYFYPPDKREQQQELLDTNVFNELMSSAAPNKKVVLMKKCVDVMRTLQ